MRHAIAKEMGVISLLLATQVANSEDLAPVVLGRTKGGRNEQTNDQEVDPSEGDAQRSDSPEGHSSEGHSSEGDPPEGDSSEGHSSEGDSSEGHSSEGHSSESDPPERRKKRQVEAVSRMGGAPSSAVWALHSSAVAPSRSYG